MHASKLWLPSVRIFGFAIGTMLLAWQMDAYLASTITFSMTASCEGMPSPILKTQHHLANRQPSFLYFQQALRDGFLFSSSMRDHAFVVSLYTWYNASILQKLDKRYFVRCLVVNCFMEQDHTS